MPQNWKGAATDWATTSWYRCPASTAIGRANGPFRDGSLPGHQLGECSQQNTWPAGSMPHCGPTLPATKSSVSVPTETVDSPEWAPAVALTFCAPSFQPGANSMLAMPSLLVVEVPAPNQAPSSLVCHATSTSSSGSPR